MDLTEVGFVIEHLVPDVVDRVDDFLACRVMLGLKWHWTMSIPYQYIDGGRKIILKHLLVLATETLNGLK